MESDEGRPRDAIDSQGMGRSFPPYAMRHRSSGDLIEA